MTTLIEEKGIKFNERSISELRRMSIGQLMQVYRGILTDLFGVDLNSRHTPLYIELGIHTYRKPWWDLYNEWDRVIINNKPIKEGSWYLTALYYLINTELNKYLKPLRTQLDALTARHNTYHDNLGSLSHDELAELDTIDIKIDELTLEISIWENFNSGKPVNNLQQVQKWLNAPELPDPINRVISSKQFKELQHDAYVKAIQMMYHVIDKQAHEVGANLVW